MRTTLLIATAALVALAAVSLVAILFVEPLPGPAPADPAAVPPDVTAAVAAAKEAAFRETEARRTAAEVAAREAAAREAAARRAVAEAAAREAAKEAAAKEAAEKEAAEREAAKELALKAADGTDAGPSAQVGSGPGAGAVRAGGRDGHSTRDTSPPTSGALAKTRDLHGTAALAARLDELKPRLAQCYAAAHPSVNPPAGPSPAGGERAIAPVFLVALESAGEHYRVVDASVDSRGSAEDVVLECMQSVLLGATFSATGSEATDRVALRFSP